MTLRLAVLKGVTFFLIRYTRVRKLLCKLMGHQHKNPSGSDQQESSCTRQRRLHTEALTISAACHMMRQRKPVQSLFCSCETFGLSLTIQPEMPKICTDLSVKQKERTSLNKYNCFSALRFGNKVALMHKSRSGNSLEMSDTPWRVVPPAKTKRLLKNEFKSTYRNDTEERGPNFNSISSFLLKMTFAF